MHEDIKKAVEVLRSGGVILFPTDTNWGLGCDATSQEAVSKIFKIMNQAGVETPVVLVDNAAKIQTYVDEVPDMAWDLIEFSEKPLTIIYPEAKNLASNLIGKDKSIGIRVTHEAFSKRLCEQFRKPIVYTSANISAKKTPLNFCEISNDIKSKVDYIVNFRQDESAKPLPTSIIKLGKGNLFEMIKE